MSEQAFLVVSDILKKSEAERIGIQKGDIIFDYHNLLINEDKQYFMTLTPKTNGLKNIELKVIRNNNLIGFNANGGSLGIMITKKIVDIPNHLFEEYTKTKKKNEQNFVKKNIDDKTNNHNQNQLNENTEEDLKYSALRTISSICNFLAVIVGIGSVVSLVFGLTLINNYSSKAAGVTLIIYSLFSGLFGIILFIAISEIIKLFIDIESNSRVQIGLLKRIVEMK